MATSAIAAAHLLLCDGDALLMSRRYNTGFQDSNYSVVAGHIEPDEPALAAARREAREEVGIELDTDDLEFVHLMYRRSAGEARTNLFLRCSRWAGVLENCEPHKVRRSPLG